MLALVTGFAVGETVGGVGGVSDDTRLQQAAGRWGNIFPVRCVGVGVGVDTGGRGWIVDTNIAQTLPQRQTVFRIKICHPTLQ